MPPNQSLAPSVPAMPNIIRAYLPRKYWHRAWDNFQFSVQFNTLAISAVAQQAQFSVQNDADFICTRITGVMADAGGTTETTYWPILIRILDSGSGAAWMDNPVHIQTIVGRNSSDGQVQDRTFPRFINAGSTVAVELTNLSATARRVFLTFDGAKIFNRLREE